MLQQNDIILLQNTQSIDNAFPGPLVIAPRGHVIQLVSDVAPAADE